MAIIAVELSLDDIKEILPHAEPFIYVDRITRCKYLDISYGYKEVKNDEFWIEGHFPGNPVFPGVLLIEVMAQIGSFIFVDVKNKHKQIGYLCQVQKIKFLDFVTIGDIIEVEAKFLVKSGEFSMVEVSAFVKGKKVATGRIQYYFPV